jgi:hypothetical protein
MQRSSKWSACVEQLQLYTRRAARAESRRTHRQTSDRLLQHCLRRSSAGRVLRAAPVHSGATGCRAASGLQQR